MKKRILSCLMALALCLTLLPTAALAEETEGTAQTPPAVEESTAPANGETKQENQPAEAKQESQPAETKQEGQPAEAKQESQPAEAKQENQPAEAKQENQPAEQGEQQEDSASKQAVADVQAMIDALPDAAELDGMDDEDAMAVYEAFQAACEAYYETLNEEQQAQLKNTEKLEKLSDWFSQPETLAAGTHQDHRVCGKSGCTETGHDEITFDKWLASSTSGGKRELRVGGNGSSETYGDPLTAESGKYVLPEGSYYLKTGVEGFDSDVTIEHPIQITGNVTICLNGQTIQSSAEGMPVFEVVSGTLTLTDCGSTGSAGKVTHASGVTGCGVEVNGGTFNLYGGSITRNTAANGGGVYVGSYGQAGTFKMYGGKITNNTATQNGGGVYVYEGTFDMDDGEISGNKTNGFGGGVYVSRGNCKFTMSGGEIKDNTARSGGGVSVFDGGVFTMRGGSITKNKTTGTGGGVSMNSGGNFTVSGKAVIKDNKMGTANNNVYLFGNKFITVSGHLDNDASIGVTMASEPAASGSVIATGNDLTAEDAAKFFSDKGGYAVSVNESKNGLLLVKAHTHYLCGGDSCNGNGHTCHAVTFTAWDSANSLPSTEGKYYLDTDVTLSSTWKPVGDTVLCLNGHNITMNGNKITAILVNSGVTFTLCDCKGGKGAYGQITHTITQYGTHYEGSGVYMTGANSKFNMYGGSISGNTADQGGGVYMAGGQFTMYGGSITKNTAKKDSQNNGGNGGNGGGVYVNRGCKFDMNGNASVSDNTATESGGGVYVGGSESTFTMNGNASITDNTAKKGGGVGVYSGATFEMNGNASITKNTAKKDSQNNGGNGGGVYMGGGKFTMNGNASITDNKANQGGGVFASAGTFEMNGTASVSGNTTTDDGGGVYMGGGKFTMNGNASITGNTASDGGGVRLSSSYSTFNMTDGTISKNEATSQGGGVCTIGNFNMSGGSITNNKAGSFGGGVKTTGSLFTMSGGSITNNETMKDGGGVYVGGPFTVSGAAKVTDNTKDGAQNNVCLLKTEDIDKTITIGEGELSGKIGVTKENSQVGSVIATGANKDYSGNFSSDDSTYVVKYKDNQLVLAAKDTTAETHTHCLCGKTHTAIGDHQTE